MTASVPARTNTVTVGTAWGILSASTRFRPALLLTTAPVQAESRRQRFFGAGAVSMSEKGTQ